MSWLSVVAPIIEMPLLNLRTAWLAHQPQQEQQDDGGE